MLNAPPKETLQMYLATIWAICQDELGRAPEPLNPDDSVAATMLHLALNNADGATIRQWLRYEPEALRFRGE